MKIIVAVASAVLMMIGTGMSGAQEAQAVDKAAEGQIVKKQMLCPITAQPINPKVYVDAQGKRVFFCCNDCPSEFKKDPSKYIKKMEADGITLDKTPTE